MLWPDVLEDMLSKINQCLVGAGEVAHVYLGASALVPTNNQINVIRGDFKPTGDDPVYCDTEAEHNLVVFVEIWGYSDVEPEDVPRLPSNALATGDDESKRDIRYENSRTIAGCREAARLSQLVRGIDFTVGQSGYSLSIVGKEGDQGQFRPTCGERIEYLIELTEA